MGMLEGALILLAGIIAGRIMPGRRKAARPAKPPSPVCGCGHHHAFHDPATGACHGTVNGEPVHLGAWTSRPDAWEQVRCTCRNYSGPLPLPEVFAPEIAAPGP